MSDETPKLYTGESHYQRRKRLEREGAAWWMPKQEEPTAEPKQAETKTDLERLIAGTDPDTMSQLIDEFGDDADFVTLAQSRLQPKNEDAEQAELKRQYAERLAKLPAGTSRAHALKRLRDEFHAKGLKEL